MSSTWKRISSSAVLETLSTPLSLCSTCRLAFCILALWLAISREKPKKFMNAKWRNLQSNIRVSMISISRVLYKMANLSTSSDTKISSKSRRKHLKSSLNSSLEWNQSKASTSREESRTLSLRVKKSPRLTSRNIARPWIRWMKITRRSCKSTFGKAWRTYWTFSITDRTRMSRNTWSWVLATPTKRPSKKWTKL